MKRRNTTMAGGGSAAAFFFDAHSQLCLPWLHDSMTLRSRWETSRIGAGKKEPTAKWYLAIHPPSAMTTHSWPFTRVGRGKEGLGARFIVRLGRFARQLLQSRRRGRVRCGRKILWTDRGWFRQARAPLETDELQRGSTEEAHPRASAENVGGWIHRLITTESVADARINNHARTSDTGAEFSHGREIEDWSD
jgi:hypothetical protein